MKKQSDKTILDLPFEILMRICIMSIRPENLKGDLHNLLMTFFGLSNDMREVIESLSKCSVEQLKFDGSDVSVVPAPPLDVLKKELSLPRLSNFWQKSLQPSRYPNAFLRDSNERFKLIDFYIANRRFEEASDILRTILSPELKIDIPDSSTAEKIFNSSRNWAQKLYLFLILDELPQVFSSQLRALILKNLPNIPIDDKHARTIYYFQQQKDAFLQLSLLANDMGTSIHGIEAMRCYIEAINVYFDKPREESNQISCTIQ